jgi:hypothetical protein
VAEQPTCRTCGQALPDPDIFDRVRADNQARRDALKFRVDPYTGLQERLDDGDEDASG